MRTQSHFTGRRLAMATAMALAISHVAYAQSTHTWTTTSSGNWSVTTNWTGGAAPDGNDILNFGVAGTGGAITATNNISGLNAGYRIFFNTSGRDFTLAQGSPNTGPFTLFDFGSTAPLIQANGGASRTLTVNFATALNGTNGGGFAELQPTLGTLTFGNTLDLAGTTQLRVTNGGGTLNLNGVISSTGNSGNNSVALNAANTTVNFGAANTYAGDTFVNAGTLQFNSTSASANSSTIRLGDTSGSNAATFTLGVTGGGVNASSTLVVRPGSSGTKTFSSTNTSGTNTFTGNVYLDAPLTVSNVSGGTLSLTGSGATPELDLKGNTLTLSNAGTVAISSAIKNTTGSGTLTLNGAGAVTLSGANSFAGGVNVNAGTLNVNSTTALGTGTVTIAGGATMNNTSGAAIVNPSNNAQNWNGDFTYTGSNALNIGTGNVALSATRTVTVNGSDANGLTVGGVVSGSGFGITKSGAGTLTLNGANTFSGAVTINAGVLSTSQLADGGTASGIGQAGIGAANLVFNGGTLRYTGAGQSSNRAFTLNTTGGTIDSSGTSAVNLTATGGVTLGGTGARTFTLSGSNTGANTFAGSLANDGSNVTNVTKSGPGTWVLTGNNSGATGALVISNGTLRLGAANAMPQPNNSTTGLNFGSTNLADTGILDLNGYSVSSSSRFNRLSNSSGNGRIINSSATFATFTASSGSGEAIGSGSAGQAPGGQLIIGGATPSSPESNLGWTHAGNQSYIYNTANTYNGPFTITAGTAQATILANGGVASSIGGASSTASNIVLAGGTLSYTGSVDGSTDRLFTFGTGTGNFTANLANNSSANASVSWTGTGDVALGGTAGNRTLGLTGSSTGTNTFAPRLVNPSYGSATALNVNTSGTWKVTNANTYTGATTLTAGTLEISSIANGGVASNIGQSTSAAANLIFTGGTLRYVGAAVTTDRLFRINQNSSATIDSSGSGALQFGNSGNIDLSGSGTRQLILTGSAGTTALPNVMRPNLGDNPAVTGLGSITKSGSGVWSLTGNNTYTGGTNINGGTLVVGSSGALSNAGTISFGGGTLQFTSVNTTDYSARFSTVANQAYSINTNGQSIALATALTSTGGTLAKSGTGTLTLSTGVTHTYTGTTSVTAGTLLVDGTLDAQTSAVSVSSGATIGGNGTINRPVGVAGGGNLAPGASAGTLAVVGAVTLADTSNLNYELDAASTTVGDGVNDLLTVNGNFTLDGVLNVTSLGGDNSTDFLSATSGTTWRLVNYAGGTFTDNSLSLGTMPTLGAGLSWSLVLNTGQVDLTIVAVPEPAVVVGVLLIGAAGLKRRRATL